MPITAVDGISLNVNALFRSLSARVTNQHAQITWITQFTCSNSVRIVEKQD